MHQKKEKKSKNTIPLASLCITVFSVMIIGVFAVSMIRQNKEKIYPVNKINHQKREALTWLDAVKNKDQRQAILIAEKLLTPRPVSAPDTDYIQILLELRISSVILTSPFNKFDFMRWHDAMIIKNIVESDDIMQTDKALRLEALFRKMQNKIKGISGSQKKYVSSPSLGGIWQKEKASPQELCRLFAAIALQAGYDVQIVKMFNKERQMVHLFCEIRKKEKTFVADPRFNYFAADVSAELFANDAKTIPEVWPEKVKKGLNTIFYDLPAEVGDYKIANQLLYAKLKELDDSKIPLFGKDPRTRIDSYIKKYKNKNKNTYFTYWTFPFNSLISFSEFPIKWRLRQVKNLDKY